MVRGWDRMVLRVIRQKRRVMLSEHSEAFRQRVINLAMMEPPLVDAQGDEVSCTAAGIEELEHIPELDDA